MIYSCWSILKAANFSGTRLIMTRQDFRVFFLSFFSLPEQSPAAFSVRGKTQSTLSQNHIQVRGRGNSQCVNLFVCSCSVTEARKVDQDVKLAQAARCIQMHVYAQVLLAAYLQLIRVPLQGSGRWLKRSQPTTLAKICWNEGQTVTHLDYKWTKSWLSHVASKHLMNAFQYKWDRSLSKQT